MAHSPVLKSIYEFILSKFNPKIIQNIQNLLGEEHYS